MVYAAICERIAESPLMNLLPGLSNVRDDSGRLSSVPSFFLVCVLLPWFLIFISSLPWVHTGADTTYGVAERSSPKRRCVLHTVEESDNQLPCKRTG